MLTLLMINQLMIHSAKKLKNVQSNAEKPLQGLLKEFHMKKLQ